MTAIGQQTSASIIFFNLSETRARSMIWRLLRLLRLQQAAGNNEFDDYDSDEGRCFCFFDVLLKEKNLLILIPAAAGSSLWI